MMVSGGALVTSPSPSPSLSPARPPPPPRQKQTGLAFDRRWMLVREDTGRFLSQREVPRMCLIRPELHPLDAPALGTTAAKRLKDAALVLHAPPGVALPPLRVPLAPPSSNTRTATVWGFTGDVLDEGDEAAEWCTRAIAEAGGNASSSASPAPRPAGSSTKRRFRLVRHAPELNPRTVDPTFALPGTTVGFADEFPLLAATEGSLRDLNARLKQTDPSAAELSMARFRPNLVFRGGEATESPWADDGWARVRVSGGQGQKACEFAYVKPCSRCKVTTVDQETGAAGEQPLPLLRSFRSGVALGWDATRPSFKHAVHFGWNVQPVVPGAGEGESRGGNDGGYEAYTGEGPLCMLERGGGAEVVARRQFE